MGVATTNSVPADIGRLKLLYHSEDERSSIEAPERQP